MDRRKEPALLLDEHEEELFAMIPEPALLPDEHEEELFEEELFAMIPADLIRSMFQYADIPSLAVLSQTSKPACNRISCLASDETTWLAIVQRRFNLGSAVRLAPPRPKSYGGTTWKTSYRSMAVCNRMPRNRFSSKSKVIFAKGGGGRGGASHVPFDGVSFVKPQATPDRDFVSLWVMLGHTSNCIVRTAAHEVTETRSRNNGADSGKVVELHLCMQNVRSGFGTVDLDVLTASVEMIGNPGGSNGSLANGVVENGPHKPKVLYRSIGRTTLFSDYERRRRSCMSDFHTKPSSLCDDAFDSSTESQSLSRPYGLTLKPFEFVVVSVHVPCLEDMTFETDFLTRALRVHVPARLHIMSQCDSPAIDSSNESIEADLDCDQTKNGNDGDRSVLAYTAAVTFTSLACASFIGEHDVWNHYTELPGGCLTLTDRSRLIAV